MVQILTLVVVGTVILGVAHGASVATAAAKGKNCTVADGFLALSCVMRISDFGVKIDQLDLDNKDEVTEFKRSCDSLQNCLTSLTCGETPDAETEKAVNSIKNYCNAVVYISTEFGACSEKLEAKKSQCFDDWNPFPEDIEEEKDEKKKAEMKKNACENYFGKDMCLKKEITETCSEMEWQGFFDHFTSIANLAHDCDVTAVKTF